MFAANCVEDPRDTSEYYQRARKIYRHWQDYHAPSQAPAIEKLAPKMEALRELVEEERIAWEEAQERLRDEEAESPVDEADDSENGSFQSENVDDEEHESIVADDVEKAAKDEPSGGLAYRVSTGHLTMFTTVTNLEQPKSSKSQDT